MNPRECFHTLPGVLHVPRTLVILEVQEESDISSVFQVKCGNRILPKEEYLLNGPKIEEEAIELIDWNMNMDPSFYRKYHIVPEPIVEDRM